MAEAVSALFRKAVLSPGLQSPRMPKGDTRSGGERGTRHLFCRPFPLWGLSPFICSLRRVWHVCVTMRTVRVLPAAVPGY